MLVYNTSMFHHTHSYLASKITDSEEPLVLLGSMLPDLAITGVISWEQGLHGAEADFQFTEFIEQNYPAFINLAKGVHAHNVVDDFTHLDYKGKPGYAFQNNKELVLLVGNFYELDEEKAKSKAHNFIESSVDIQLINDMPEIQTKLRMAINQIEREKIAKILAEFLRKDRQKIFEALNIYLELFTKYDFSKQGEWVSFWIDLEKYMKLKNIGNGKRTQLLNKANEATEKTYKAFINFVLTTKKIINSGV